MKTILDHGKRQGFVQIVLLVLLALGFLGAGGVYLAKRNSPAPVVASAPVVAPEPVVEQVATSTEPVPEPEEVGTEPATSPVAPVTKPIPSPAPVVVATAPTPAPAPVTPDQLAEDIYFLESVLVVVRSDKAAWVKYAEDADARQAAALRNLAAQTNNIETGGYQEVIDALTRLRQLLIKDAESREAQKAGEMASYEKMFGPIEAAISARLATLTTSNLLTSDELLKYGGYRAQAPAAAGKVEDAKWYWFKQVNTGEFAQEMWSLVEDQAEVNRLLAGAEQSAKPVVPRPILK